MCATCELYDRAETQYHREKAAALQRNVPRAAAILDEVKPGWEDLVDTERLQMYSCERCVLGQVFHEEANATKRSREEYAHGYGYGLYGPPSQQLFPRDGSLENVFVRAAAREMWIEQITARRMAKAIEAELAKAPAKVDHTLAA